MTGHWIEFSLHPLLSLGGGAAGSPSLFIMSIVDFSGELRPSCVHVGGSAESPHQHNKDVLSLRKFRGGFLAQEPGTKARPDDL